MKGLTIHHVRARATSLVAVGLVAALPGCGKAFTMAKPATFREPAAAFARTLKPAATEPVLRDAVAAESLRDVRLVGDRALLDLRSEDAIDGAFGTGAFGVYPACGPLEMRQFPGGHRVWSVPRPPGCNDEIIASESRIVLLGQRGAGNGASQLMTLDPATGKPIGSVSAERPAQAVTSGEAIVLVQGKVGARRAALHEGDQLVRKWEARLGDESQPVTKVLTIGETVMVLGSRVTAIARVNGHVSKSTAFDAGAVTLDALPAKDGAYALVANVKAKTTSVARITSDGAIAWKQPAKGVLDSVTPTGVLLVDGATVTALTAASGAVAWTAKLPSVASGAGLVVGSTFLVPHVDGVSALDAATGTLAYSLAPFGATSNGQLALADRLTAAGEGLVLLDTARGVASIEVRDTKGSVRWAISVRSLPHVTRQGRLLLTLGKFDENAARLALHRIQQNQAATADLFATVNKMGGGGTTMAGLETTLAMQNMGAAAAAGNWAMFVESLNMRKHEHLRATLAQGRIDDASPMIVRPISWATGRGLLVVRKSDGAFREIVTGPPDIYEDSFRQASVGAYIPQAKAVLTVSEGIDARKWVDAKEQRAVKLVVRGLLGYGLDDAALLPVGEYATRSIVPAGSFD